MTEREVLRNLKRGDPEALGWFIDRYTPYVITVICNVIGGRMSTCDIEEAASDVFLAFWQNAGKVRPLSVKGYLGTIARNRAKNKLRQLGLDYGLEEETLAVDGITPEQIFQQKELQETVRSCVLGMEEPDREIFLRHYYYHQKTQQIAQEMGMNHSTVRSRLRRGRESLKRTLEAYVT